MISKTRTAITAVSVGIESMPSMLNSLHFEAENFTASNIYNSQVSGYRSSSNKQHYPENHIEHLCPVRSAKLTAFGGTGSALSLS